MIGQATIRSFFVLLVTSVLVSGGYAQQVSLIAPTEPLTAIEQQQKFHLPSGFEIQLVATEPDIAKPMNIRFDHRGRLFVTDSLEYPFPAADDGPKRDAVHRLEDFDENGRATTITKVVDGLNIPIGLLPVGDSVIYHTIPQLDISRDTDGDGVYDEQEMLYGTIESRDTHGMCNSLNRWLDGWIYACHGFANTSTVQGSDGQAITMNSGNTWRMQPDGSHCEYWTHGQVNPFGMCWDPLGNQYTSDCHTKPIYMLLRGAWYPSFGKPHDGMGFGPGMIKHLHGSTGIAGIVYYSANHFPRSYRDTVFIGNPVTGRVNRDHFDIHGSTYEAIEEPDFISCDDPWFRPVDLQLGPDGALYIADFYNRIIGHYEVPLTHPGRDRHRGRIWRVVYTGNDDDAHPLQPLPILPLASTEQLIEMLDNPNLARRTMATHELVDRVGQSAIRPATAIVENGTENQRTHGMWVLYRLDSLYDALIDRLASDPSRMVRTHLMKVLGEREAWDSVNHMADLAISRLEDEDAFVRRAAADALGRHPNLRQVEPLLKLWQSTDANDTHLIHVTRMAVRDTMQLPGAFDELSEMITSNGAYADHIADVSEGIPTERSAQFLLQYLTTSGLEGRDLERLLYHAARYIAEDQVPSIYGYAEIHQSADVRTQQTVLESLHRAAHSRGGTLPATATEWAVTLASKLLDSERALEKRHGIALSRELKLAGVYDQLALLAISPDHAELRVDAIDACIANDAGRTVPMLGNILGNGNETIDIRQKAASALGGVGSPDAREVLIQVLPSAPERLAVEIATALASNRDGAEALLTAIETGKATARLLQEKAIVDRLRGSGAESLDARRETLTASLPHADERLAMLVNQRREGFQAAETDLAAGHQVFLKHCTACHRIGAEGNKIGPELDGVGQRGLERLLEDVLDPSRNVDQAFRSTLISTDEGRVISGLVLREEGQVLVLADNQGKEVRVELDSIDEKSVSSLSPMPANVVDIVSEPDFYQLIAYLLSQRTLSESTQSADASP